MQVWRREIREGIIVKTPLLRNKRNQTNGVENGAENSQLVGFQFLLEKHLIQKGNLVHALLRSSTGRKWATKIVFT